MVCDAGCVAACCYRVDLLGGKEVRKGKRFGDSTPRYGWILDPCTVLCEKCTRGRLGPNSENWGATQDRGEVDAPQHCEQCAVLLPNPLTTDGQEYVKEKVASNEGSAEILALWRVEFSYLFD